MQVRRSGVWELRPDRQLRTRAISSDVVYTRQSDTSTARSHVLTVRDRFRHSKSDGVWRLFFRFSFQPMISDQILNLTSRGLSPVSIDDFQIVFEIVKTASGNAVPERFTSSS
ncbi:hypothetical protein CKA32_000816 [Geitlerinema sp. FC II]|nr:hypothetical protein CKA32_000816 [Geitlerinema sp. FC II]